MKSVNVADFYRCRFLLTIVTGKWTTEGIGVNLTDSFSGSFCLEIKRDFRVSHACASRFSFKRTTRHVTFARASLSVCSKVSTNNEPHSRQFSTLIILSALLFILYSNKLVIKFQVKRVFYVLIIFVLSSRIYRLSR